MNEKSVNDQYLVFSTNAHRTVIGVLGMTLPFALWLGGLIVFRTGLQGSLSGYYYTGMRDWFVGSLWAIGFFLFSYQGYKYKGDPDNFFSNLACCFAIGAALFPTTPEGPVSTLTKGIGFMHVLFAGGFFVTLSYFCLALFPKTHPGQTVIAHSKKELRNKIYRGCGYTIIACMALIVVLKILPDTLEVSINRLNPVFYLESIAILAFGVSWFTKGEALKFLQDSSQK